MMVTKNNTINNISHQKFVQHQVLNSYSKELDVSNSAKKCSKGYRLTEHDYGLTCNAICDSKDYVFAQYDKFNGMYIDGKLLVGKYCMPKTLAYCNTRTSYIVAEDNNKYSCKSKFPELLGGEYGNEILGCNGSLEDVLTKKIYVNFLPKFIRLTDPNEIMSASFSDSSSTEYRYRCSKQRDSRDNEYISRMPITFSRFDYTVNECAVLMNNSDNSVKPNWETGTCNCGVNSRIKNLHGNKTFPCTSCLTSWKSIGSTFLQGGDRGIGLGRSCINDKVPINLWPVLKIMCGVQNREDVDNNNNKTTTCERGVIGLTASYSPQAQSYLR